MKVTELQSSSFYLKPTAPILYSLKPVLGYHYRKGPHAGRPEPIQTCIYI